MPNPFKPIFKIGKATLKAMMWLVWTVRIILFLGFVFVAISVSWYFISRPNIPDSKEAPFAVVAITSDNLSVHTYYASNVLDNGPQDVLIDYWLFNGKGYSLIKGEKPLVKADWGSISIFRR